MRTAHQSKVGTRLPQRGFRVLRNSAGDGGVKPEALAIVPCRGWRRQRLNVAAVHPSMHVRAVVLQNAAIDKVDDVLSR